LGTIIDIGPDILVICHNNKYLYCPIRHIQRLEVCPEQPDRSLTPAHTLLNHQEPISFPQMIKNAKGGFVEMFVCGNQPLYGYITNILEDYLVFYSLGHKTTLIPLYHVKWLSPLPPNQVPYSHNKQGIPVDLSDSALSSKVEEQLKKYEGKIVILDMGSSPEKSGILKKIEKGVIELETFNGKKVYWNMHHMKTVHFPE
jgi:hypothetical protein